jgi:hypothetical protein
LGLFLWLKFNKNYKDSYPLQLIVALIHNTFRLFLKGKLSLY